MSRKKTSKVKRPRVDWKKVLFEQAMPDAQTYFFYLKKRWMVTIDFHLTSKMPSDNRLARAALLHYYSYQKLERVRWLGESL